MLKTSGSPRLVSNLTAANIATNNMVTSNSPSPAGMLHNHTRASFQQMRIHSQSQESFTSSSFQVQSATATTLLFLSILFMSSISSVVSDVGSRCPKCVVHSLTSLRQLTHSSLPTLLYSLNFTHSTNSLHFNLINSSLPTLLNPLKFNHSTST